MDVTKEEEVQTAFEEIALKYGGIDILVNNAGLATSSPLDETTLEEWNLNMNVLGTGYFLVAREAFKQMKNKVQAAAWCLSVRKIPFMQAKRISIQLCKSA